MNIKEGVELITDDFWNDVLDNDYIIPEDVLTLPSDIHIVKEAIKTLRTFKAVLEKTETIIYR